MLFSHSFCLYISNFRRSDWSRTQNVNKRADWLTFFTLVALGSFVGLLQLCTILQANYFVCNCGAQAKSFGIALCSVRCFKFVSLSVCQFVSLSVCQFVSLCGIISL